MRLLSILLYTNRNYRQRNTSLILYQTTWTGRYFPIFCIPPTPPPLQQLTDATTIAAAHRRHHRRSNTSPTPPPSQQPPAIPRQLQLKSTDLLFLSRSPLELVTLTSNFRS
ncbi:hypothetical protein L1887_14811 [Cichorium endivia]|nr:hypothetical protein L1887_14811 [Cichorium endivia]